MFFVRGAVGTYDAMAVLGFSGAVITAKEHS